MAYLLQKTTIKVKGADIFGDTALHLAARMFHLSCLREMLLFKEDLELTDELLNVRNKKGETPLTIVSGTMQRVNRDLRFQQGAAKFVVPNDAVVKMILDGVVVWDLVPETILKRMKKRGEMTDTNPNRSYVSLNDQMDKL